MKSRSISVKTLARVEGEGGILVRVRNGAVDTVQMQIYEPPRFFEAFLRGRSYEEAPDITARICGICPVAYQMTAVHAIESAFGVVVDPAIRTLRRLLYCGEWIESHALHIYLLHAPDFFGLEDGIQLAAKNKESVVRGLRLKKTGNRLVEVIGGREIHPVNVRVGGFYRVPAKRELLDLRDELLWARDAAIETVSWVATLDFPDFERDYLFVALRHENEYPMNEGRIVSSAGLDITPPQFESTFHQEHRQYSNALFSSLKGRDSYCVGPLARYNLNYDRLPLAARQAADHAGLSKECRNPFKSIVVRAVETIAACEEAITLVDSYEPPAKPAAHIQPRSSSGSWCTEAPRGMLFHRYVLDERGLIISANIMPPTAQNQGVIEDDLRAYVAQHLQTETPALTRECELAVRNYDPCISCATHMVTLEVE